MKQKKKPGKELTPSDELMEIANSFVIRFFHHLAEVIPDLEDADTPANMAETETK